MLQVAHLCPTRAAKGFVLNIVLSPRHLARTKMTRLLVGRKEATTRCLPARRRGMGVLLLRGPVRRRRNPPKTNELEPSPFDPLGSSDDCLLHPCSVYSQPHRFLVASRCPSERTTVCKSSGNLIKQAT